MSDFAFGVVIVAFFLFSVAYPFRRKSNPHTEPVGTRQNNMV